VSKRVFEERLDDFSARLARHHKLPPGVEFRLWYPKKKRLARVDFTVRHHAINAENVPQLPDSANVGDLLEQTVDRVISTDLDNLDIDLRLYSSEGDHLLPTNLLRTVRKLPAAPNFDSEAKARYAFHALLPKIGVKLSEVKERALYDELRGMMGFGFEEALLKHARSIHSRKDA